MSYTLYSYNSSTTKYEYELEILEQDIIEFTVEGAIFPAYTTVTGRIKNLPKYNKYVPNVRNNILSQKPLLLVDERLNVVNLTFFVIGREVYNSKENTYVEFKAVDFNYFKDFKLIEGNVDYKPNQVPADDIKNPPEDLGKYKANTTVYNHMWYAFNSCFVNPLRLTYGQSVGTLDTNRKLKGCGTLTFNIPTAYNVTKNILDLLPTFTEFESRMYADLNQPLITVVKLNKITGKLDILYRGSNVVAQDIVNKNTQIIEDLKVMNPVVNLHFGFAYPFNYATNITPRPTDFTTLERAHDLNYVCQDNNTYLVNTLITLQTRGGLDLFQNIFKLNVRGAYTLFYVGDIININNTNYIISNLNVTRTLQNLNIDVKVTQYL